MNDAPDVSDETLMVRYRDGDAAAFDILYRRHKGPLYRYFLRQCGGLDRASIDELFQDVWLKLIDARHRYRPQAKFTTYLYTMAHHRLIDDYRSRRRRGAATAAPAPGESAPPGPEELPGASADQPLPRLLGEQRRQRLLAALAELPAEQREAFLLQQEAGLTLAEIAEATAVSRETVKSRLRYAVGKLRRALVAERS